MISTRQLRYLDALARHRHFGKAAAACHVTQPALSMQLQQLEAELGVKLVERHRAGAVLTAAGREMAERAGRILTAMRDMADAAHGFETPLSSTLRLGMIPTIGPYLLPRLLPELQRRFPALRLSIRESQTAVLIDELLAGTLDIVLAALPIPHPELSDMHVMEDEFLLALPPDRSPSARISASAAELIDNDRLLLLEEGHCLRDQALDICDLRQATAVNLFGASSLSTIVQMVANGMGMTLLPEISLPVETAGDRVKLVRFAPPAPRRTLGLLYRRNSSRAEDCLALKDAVRDCRRELAEGGRVA
jgi:LysR family hydrogen peroxide-inducible transcriptional activator